MILLMGGTTEGRELFHLLRAAGYEVVLTTATAYGAELAGVEHAGFSNRHSFLPSAEAWNGHLPDRDGALVVGRDVPSEESGDGPALNRGGTVISGMLDAEGIEELINRLKARVLVDATHPFAVEASKNARRAAERCGIAYIRFERAYTDTDGVGSIYLVDSFEAAAHQAVNLGNVIFLAIGSKNLGIFQQVAGGAGKRLVARVMPDPDVIKQCIQYGFAPGDLIAMQGPFSRELNVALMRQYGAEVLVTKESGPTGGTREKLEAARDLGIPVVLITRPHLEYGLAVSDYKTLMEKVSRVL